MSLWRIPNPWDYHEIAGIFVVAATKDEAVEKAKARLAEKQAEFEASEKRSYDPEFLDEGDSGSAERVRVAGRWDDQDSRVDWDKITEITDVFFANGCDD